MVSQTESERLCPDALFKTYSMHVLRTVSENRDDLHVQQGTLDDTAHRTVRRWRENRKSCATQFHEYETAQICQMEMRHSYRNALITNVKNIFMTSRKAFSTLTKPWKKLLKTTAFIESIHIYAWRCKHKTEQRKAASQSFKYPINNTKKRQINKLKVNYPYLFLVLLVTVGWACHSEHVGAVNRHMHSVTIKFKWVKKLTARSNSKRRSAGRGHQWWRQRMGHACLTIVILVAVWSLEDFLYLLGWCGWWHLASSTNYKFYIW